MDPEILKLSNKVSNIKQREEVIQEQLQHLVEQIHLIKTYIIHLNMKHGSYICSECENIFLEEHLFKCHICRIRICVNCQTRSKILVSSKDLNEGYNSDYDHKEHYDDKGTTLWVSYCGQHVQ